MAFLVVVHNLSVNLVGVPAEELAVAGMAKCFCQIRVPVLSPRNWVVLYPEAPMPCESTHVGSIIMDSKMPVYCLADQLYQNRAAAALMPEVW